MSIDGHEDGHDNLLRLHRVRLLCLSELCMFCAAMKCSQLLPPSLSPPPPRIPLYTPLRLPLFPKLFLRSQTANSVEFRIVSGGGVSSLCSFFFCVLRGVGEIYCGLVEVRLANGMGDPSVVSAQAWGNWNVSSSEKRSSNYPLKRSYQTGWPEEAVVVALDINGVNRDNAAAGQVMISQREHNHSHYGNGNEHLQSFKCRGGASCRTSFIREKSIASVASLVGKRGKTTSFNVYRILISIVAILFLIETVTHGFVFLLFRDTDLQAESLEIFPRVFGIERAAAGDDVRFVPRNVVERLLLSKGKATVAELRKETRSPVRFLRLALVCSNLLVNPLSLYVLSIATGLQELGYNLEVHTLKDGELRSTWEALGVPVRQLKINIENVTSVDWLNYEGVIAFSANTKPVLNCLAQEPFINIPVVWVITDDALGRRLGDYDAAAANGLISDWRLSFKRADVVVFQDYQLPVIYTVLDTGNFFVIPGSPAEVWTAEKYKLSHSRESLRAQHRVGPDDSVIAVVGSPFLYLGLWREHALVMRALARVVSKVVDASPEGCRRILLLIIGHGNQSISYGAAVQVMAKHLGLKKGTVHYVGAGEDVTGMLWMSDAVLYGSFRDEQAFPPILSRAMSLQRPVIAPNRSAFREQIVDGKNGVLFPVGDDMKLSDAIVHVLKDKSVGAMAVNGQSKARNMFASNVILNYGKLLEIILEFPLEAELPRPLDEAAKTLKGGWCWDVLFPARGSSFPESFQSHIEEPTFDENGEGSGIIEMLEHQWIPLSGEIQKIRDKVGFAKSIGDWDFLSEFDLDEAKAVERDLEAERIEREELDGRKVQLQSSWEDITKMVKKTEVHKDDLNERSEAEIQRSGQPLCIYEPYTGKGAWPFLHDENTLYRGLSLSTRARRPGDDDVDAQERLTGLLNDSYYRDVLCEYGAFFAIANRIDFVHKSPWIGFQSWRASSKNVALTAPAEAALSEAVSSGRDGDAVYFWARSDGHAGTLHRDSPEEQPEDFWAYCDSINSGRCREAFAGSLRRMYGLPANWTALPPMPAGSGTWSALHSWAMPTSSFVELVLFARIFVDALDSQYYEEHHELGRCCFVRFQREGLHCYCRLLEGLVNVWAYHSARRMIYVDPQTGNMEEQHALESRHGKMWVKFFSLSTLKAMDEDLAEAADDGDHPRERWLWPQTGEVYWQGIADREREERLRLKQEKKQKLKEKLARMRNKTRQKSLGRFIKPPPGMGYLPPLDNLVE